MGGVLDWAQAICLLLGAWLVGIAAVSSAQKVCARTLGLETGVPTQRKRHDMNDEFVTGGKLVSSVREAESVLCSGLDMKAVRPGQEWKKQFGVPHTSLASTNQHDQSMQQVDSMFVKDISNTDYSVRSIQAEYEDSMTAENGDTIMGAQEGTLMMSAKMAKTNLDLTRSDPGSCRNGLEESFVTQRIFHVQMQQARSTRSVIKECRLTCNHIANSVGRFSSTCIAGQQNALKTSQ